MARPIIISRNEARAKLNEMISKGTFFRVTFLTKSGYPRTYSSCRANVKAHLVDPNNPQVPTTAHIPKYRVVYVMDEDTKNYRNMNLDTMRVFKSGGQVYWIANCNF